MDTRLKEWIIKKNDEASVCDSSDYFILLLRQDEEKILNIIAKNIHRWAIACMTDLKIDLSFGNDRLECLDFLKTLREHYARQLAEMDLHKKPMDDKFKQWLVRQYDLFTPFEMNIFLRLLKKNPEKVIIDIPRLARKCSMELRIDVLYKDNSAEREEILHLLKERFATQLAEIP
jgi:hypothetical protein